jgi:hypothetical protein
MRLILVAEKEWNFYFQGIEEGKEKKMHIKANCGSLEYDDIISTDESNRDLEDFIIDGKEILEKSKYHASDHFSSWLRYAIEIDVKKTFADEEEKEKEEKIRERFNAIYKLLVKEIGSKKIDPIDIIKMVDKVIVYSAAEGMDVIIQGKLFRLHDDDFLNPKNFLIWYANTFGGLSHLDIEKNEWRAIVDTWINMSVKASPGKDILAPPVITELVDKIIDNRVESEFTADTMQDLENTNIFVFVLKGNDLFLHSKIYNYLMQKYKVSARKMRQYFEHYLKGDASKQFRISGYRARFWIMDWNKLMYDFPELGGVKVIELREAESVKAVEDDKLSFSMFDQLYDQLKDSINIEALKKGISELYEFLKKKNVKIDKYLTKEVFFLLNSKETDNPDFPREVLFKLFDYFNEVKK